MKINMLHNKIGWFGKYSGYECLPQYFLPDVNATIYTAKYDLTNKILGKLIQIKNRTRHIGPEEIIAELKFKRKLDGLKVCHVMYLEQHFHLIDSLDKRNQKLIGTIHIPINYWKEENLKLLAKIDHAIILYNDELVNFSKYISLDKITFIKHGIDIDFFKPGSSNVIKKDKILFVGFFLRNFEMFTKVFEVLTKQIESLEFHFIIPGAYRQKESIQSLMKEKKVFFYENLSDEELLRHYQDSYVLLMPMEDSGANTAIIQSLATGLPIVTTDVGGIRSYGGQDIFPVVKNNDVEGMIQLFYTYYSNIEYRNDISKKQRDFAVRELDWKLIAKEHVSLYQKIGS